ncbi:alpha-amylase family protein [Corynebacterium ammoniagenes]|uniref:maltose alpha-D-glucosyltransferase n=2 Tax=Corynebacterium ammoniagenes TaxID=1697 RepID=A0AAV5G6P6_CORAM|nr:alpha-amylase family protein [Corynebacterium ammoniagenes]APT81983.1 trehalose synthase [Corynebacterium ammoniagenes DSM 20306]AQS73098.1 trehalose synthase [Corynebacterium ammoniagenes]EFG80481.1 putative maltose alpha-D-glucosyltransferase [Corynebacterium ammoniagenes DSM 20306]GJN41790.1 trehalose synthase/amylase TreS [Corynebacterium ammoniagenes]
MTHTELSTQSHVPRPWYENAVFYQILVGVFNDTAGEGIGTLKGVEEKLDYLQWLGIDCLWLSPFYASPLRDDGYDISDYLTVHPEYGTMEDFEDLIAAVHARGMKLITDLALNHTSMDHYWFQESRKNPEGPYGDYYVWGDDPDRYPDIRIIFTDVESSNWSFDEVRGQYYFHRFYKEQPDLNYDNPAVHEEVLSLVDFWMGKGLDGFRLDAIPYLYERDDTGGESIPETIEFIEKLRVYMDEHYPDAFMVAEANQPPAETREYFGDGNRMHMVFNFPLMPRLYQAIATSQASPIEEIMPELLHLPPGTQWGNFLRNHDELTLEMVSEFERDLLYSAFLPHDSMRAHLGIARRLAPLMDNDRAKIELMFALMFGLPGAPFVYYGEEIGMQDDPSLQDRDAVRTPMQWEPGPGAGFTTSETPKRPIVGGFGLSVAEQRHDPDSLLRFVRSLIAARKAHPEIGIGNYESIAVTEPSLLAILRTLKEEDRVIASDPLGSAPLVCLYNFAPYPIDIPKQALTPLGGVGHVEIGSEHGVSEVRAGDAIPAFGYLWLSALYSA